MTQEQKDLLLKDLCARLQYFTKVQIKNEIVVLDSICDDDGYHFNFIGDDREGVNIENIKPYLFPLSSMTEEQKKDIFHNGKFYIDHHNSLCRFPMYEDDYDFVTMEDCLEIFNKLNKYHFDYRGLIPMGLAIDATGLNIY